MTELLLFSIAVGAAILAYKSGLEISRKQVLDELTQRVARTIQSGSEFSAKYGVKGGFLAIDYFPEGSMSGSGYNSFVDGQFVVIEKDDFYRIVAQSRNLDESTTD